VMLELITTSHFVAENVGADLMFGIWEFPTVNILGINTSPCPFDVVAT